MPGGAAQAQGENRGRSPMPALGCFLLRGQSLPAPGAGHRTQQRGSHVKQVCQPPQLRREARRGGSPRAKGGREGSAVLEEKGHPV